jgi:hypothetical protein
MVQQRLQAARQTLGQHWRVVVLVALLVLLEGGYAVGKLTATSMNITVWNEVVDINDLSTRPPPKYLMFDKTISNQPLVHDTEQQLDGLPWGGVFQPQVIGQSIFPRQQFYVYRFSFATFGVVTQVYEGGIGVLNWTVTTWGISLGVARADTATLYGYNLMTTLHNLTGMPLPRGWNATSPAN